VLFLGRRRVVLVLINMIGVLKRHFAFAIVALLVLVGVVASLLYLIVHVSDVSDDIVLGEEIYGDVKSALDIDIVDISEGGEEYNEVVEVNYDDDLFWKSVKGGDCGVSGVGKVVGGVVPHHMLAGDLIADAFECFVENSEGVNTVVLIGPNHPDLGGGYAIVADSDFDVGFGILKSDYDLVSDLVLKNSLVVDNNIIKNEHSVTTLMPYVKKYFPDAKIVPVVIHSSQGMKRSAILGESLKRDGVLVVASVDFSHYLDREETEKNDLVTKEALVSRDYDSIFEMNSDYLDSQGSILTMFSYADLYSAETEIIKNTNSARIVGDDFGLNTSYFTILYRISD